MAYVVTENCVDCKYGDCVEVCPVNCFYQGEAQLYINPEECIDCEACVPECPVDAIFSDADSPQEWTDTNANFDYKEEARVTSKDEVVHGPKFKEE